jgi:hypothetical protein
MNLPALYRLFAQHACRNGEIKNFPSWEKIAEAAEVDPLDDAAAVRALIEKGAIVKTPLGPATFSDYRYVIKAPRVDAVKCFHDALSTIGACVKPYILE